MVGGSAFGCDRPSAGCRLGRRANTRTAMRSSASARLWTICQRPPTCLASGPRSAALAYAISVSADDGNAVVAQPLEQRIC
jgi:hypothetical protein